MERQRKHELWDLNARAWAGDRNVFPVGDSLDSSMKRNTAFIKRLRTAITASATNIFLQEIRTLSLHKYLSEIISACYEGLSKLKLPVDIAAGVEIFSALHQRFGPEEFTSYVGWLVGRGLSTPDKAQLKALPQDVREKEEKERIARHRTLLRVATELWLTGALRSLDDAVRPEEAAKLKENVRVMGTAAQKTGLNRLGSSVIDAEPFPLEVLKDLLSQDSQHVNLPLVVQFVKVFGWDLLRKKGLEEDGLLENDQPMVDFAMQQRFKNVLVRYFENGTSHLARDQANLNSQSRRNAEAYIRSGEIFEDRQANYEKQVKAQEKFVANMLILADALDVEMPDLKEKDPAIAAPDGTIGLVKTGEFLRGVSDGSGIWEDEDERRFYENLIDLKDRVPGTLLGDTRKKKPESEEQVGKKMDDKHSPKSEDDKCNTENVQTKHEDDQSTSIVNNSVGTQVDALLARLSELTSKEMVDEFAIDFCFLNSKASRNRLIKAVQEVPRGRSDLLPLYSRLVTTLGKYMHDISQGLVSYLDEEFRSLQRRKQKDSLGGVRTSNIRYLAELTKFGLVPEHVIFHCLKVSLDEFSKMNIEIICNLLENCGRYLLRNPDTVPRMKSFLETLQRKKGAQHLGQQERMLIENATYYVNPPEMAAIQQKERTPMDMYIRKLIYLELTKRNLEKAAKQIRKLHWEEPEVVDIVRKVFTKPGKIKYSNIHFLAIILGTLNRYHQDFTVSVIDDLLEYITVGLELNDFKLNQRRLAEVKYLGELYVYRMIDSSIVFDTMFKILTFGHDGWPRQDNLCLLDLPDDFFRIRLVCNILETCGMYYEKGAAKKKLDFFLTFFQYYIHTKDLVPMDIEFVIQDAFALVRPQWKLASGLEEAGSTFADACKENYKSTGTTAPADADEHEELDDETEAGGRRTPLAEADKSSGDEAEGIGEDQPKTPDADTDEEQQIFVTRPEDERDPEAEADFDRELAKMMSEPVETRKIERKPMSDLALPMRRSQRESSTVTDSERNESPALTSNTIKFSLLSKKGNRPQTRSIDLPVDSNFAVAMRVQQETERAEQQRIKKLVLNYDMCDDGDADGDPSFIYILQPNLNRRYRTINAETLDTEGLQTLEKPHPQHQLYTAPPPAATTNSATTQSQPRGGISRRQQTKKLQLSDVDWYGSASNTISPTPDDKPSDWPSLEENANAPPQEPGSRRGRGRRVFKTVG